MAEKKNLKVGFIGAGPRARSGHYPVISRLKDVSLEAVAEMDESLLNEVKDKYGIGQAFLCKGDNDFMKMIETVDLDIVYVIMHEKFMTAPAVACLEAGKHVFIEKPAGLNSDESRQLLEAAIANDVYCCVGYQRRYAHVTQEAMRVVKNHGPAALALGEFHKKGDFRVDSTDQVWRDTAHVIDLVRYMVGSDAKVVHAYQDATPTGQKNMFASLIRFASQALGFVTASRMAGGRLLRAELHGLHVDTYLYPPDTVEIHEAGEKPRILKGSELAGVADDDSAAYGGELVMHQQFADCVRESKVPLTDIRDVIHTSILVDQVAGLA